VCYDCAAFGRREEISELLAIQNLVGIALPVLILGSYTLLRLAWRKDFFGTYYFAYAPASGRRFAPGRVSRK
jgi:hypothetical protein